jgi:hypothetical protein
VLNFRGPCVYFARTAGGLVKIGYTTGIGARLHTLALQQGGERLVLLHRITTTSPRWLELLMHHLFREKHVEGELFRLTEEDLEQVYPLRRVDRHGRYGWGPSQPDWADTLSLPERQRLVEVLGVRVFHQRPGTGQKPFRPRRPGEQPLLWPD